MILEIADIRIPAGQNAAFEEAIQRALSTVASRAKGFKSASVQAGILEWNKAFERIGFTNAIEVRQQTDDADFDTLGVVFRGYHDFGAAMTEYRASTHSTA